LPVGLFLGNRLTELVIGRMGADPTTMEKSDMCAASSVSCSTLPGEEIFRDETGELQRFARTVSRELHDNIAQSMAAALTRMELAEHYLDNGDTAAALDKWGKARDAARQALVMTKALAIRARTFFAVSVPAARESVENTTRLPHRDIPREEIFLILREAVNNALSHSGADDITIRLSVSQEHVSATVHDNGSGLPPEQLHSPTSLGLRSMCERVRLLGGTLALTSRRSVGTWVRVRVPLPAAARSG
jgi:signal transduction histidine kinase